MRPLTPLVALASLVWAVTGCGARSAVISPETAPDASTEAGVAPAVQSRADAAADAVLDVIVPFAHVCHEPAAVGSGCSTVNIIGGCRSDEYGIECVECSECFAVPYVAGTCRPVGPTPPAGGAALYCCLCQ